MQPPIDGARRFAHFRTESAPHAEGRPPTAPSRPARPLGPDPGPHVERTPADSRLRLRDPYEAASGAALETRSGAVSFEAL
ncbi:hypothetical protein ACFQ8C_28610 [Streptomyces sp. NPDC056503]|uniref:hypothetical protein n=1 Tax=Streptomyces sp. NPDC056503 TaxID=3345842 RepID=UPI0036ABF041